MKMRTKRNNKLTKIIIAGVLAAALVLVSALVFSEDVLAQGQETCPSTGDWVKVEPVDAQFLDYDAPEGKVIVETCYKAGTTLVYETIDPAQSSITLTTEVPNPNDNGFLNISHASFRLADEEKEEERPYVSISYICQANVAGIVKELGLEVQPGERIWKVTHESGPATSFSTNLLSDVQGFIEVGQTLYFVTSQSANGVTVITSPLENLFDGSVSVTDAVCDVPEEEKDPEDLILLGQCLGDGTIEWEVSNPNDFAVEFSWKTNDDQSGDLEVAASGMVTFKTSTSGSMLYLSYAIDEEEKSLEEVVEVCEEPKETEDPEPDVPAGGMGPSLISIAAPILIGLGGVGATAAIIKIKADKKRN